MRRRLFARFVAFLERELGAECAHGALAAASAAEALRQEMGA
jgi:hypothetical protein